MNSYRESEHAITDTTSRRGLVISFFKRLSLCGLAPATSRASVAEKESGEFSVLARYVTLHDVAAAIARRQRVAKHLKEAGSPRVGVFWFIQEPGEAPKIVASSVAIQQGKAYGMYIDGREDHVSVWPGSFQYGNGPFRG